MVILVIGSETGQMGKLAWSAIKITNYWFRERALGMRSAAGYMGQESGDAKPEA